MGIGYRSLYKEMKCRESMTTLGDAQLDKMWKRISNKFSNDYNYVHNIVKEVEKSIDTDLVRDNNIDQASYTDMIIEAVMGEIDNNRNVENKFKETDIVRNLQNIIPSFWMDLVNKVNSEQEIIYDIRRDEVNK